MALMCDRSRWIRPFESLLITIVIGSQARICNVTQKVQSREIFRYLRNRIPLKETKREREDEDATLTIHKRTVKYLKRPTERRVQWSSIREYGVSRFRAGCYSKNDPDVRLLTFTFVALINNHVFVHKFPLTKLNAFYCPRPIGYQFNLSRNEQVSCFS